MADTSPPPSPKHRPTMPKKAFQAFARQQRTKAPAPSEPQDSGSWFTNWKNRLGTSSAYVVSDGFSDPSAPMFPAILTNRGETERFKQDTEARQQKGDPVDRTQAMLEGGYGIAPALVKDLRILGKLDLSDVTYGDITSGKFGPFYPAIQALQRLKGEDLPSDAPKEIQGIAQNCDRIYNMLQVDMNVTAALNLPGMSAMAMFGPSKAYDAYKNYTTTQGHVTADGRWSTVPEPEPEATSEGPQGILTNANVGAASILHEGWGLERTDGRPGASGRISGWVHWGLGHALGIAGAGTAVAEMHKAEMKARGATHPGLAPAPQQLAGSGDTPPDTSVPTRQTEGSERKSRKNKRGKGLEGLAPRRKPGSPPSPGARGVGVPGFGPVVPKKAPLSLPRLQPAPRTAPLGPPVGEIDSFVDELLGGCEIAEVQARFPYDAGV